MKFLVLWHFDLTRLGPEVARCHAEQGRPHEPGVRRRAATIRTQGQNRCVRVCLPRCTKELTALRLKRVND